LKPRPAALTAASIFSFISGLIYTPGSIYLTGLFLRYRSLQTIFGITFYKGSFIHQLGMNWVIAANILFILLGIGNVISGVLLWRKQKSGGLLAIILFPLIMAVSIGGEAPAALLLEPIKLALVLISWRSLE